MAAQRRRRAKLRRQLVASKDARASPPAAHAPEGAGPRQGADTIQPKSGTRPSKSRSKTRAADHHYRDGLYNATITDSHERNGSDKNHKRDSFLANRNIQPCNKTTQCNT